MSQDQKLLPQNDALVHERGFESSVLPSAPSRDFLISLPKLQTESIITKEGNVWVVRRGISFVAPWKGINPTRKIIHSHINASEIPNRPSRIPTLADFLKRVGDAHEMIVSKYGITEFNRASSEDAIADLTREMLGVTFVTEKMDTRAYEKYLRDHGVDFVLTPWNQLSNDDVAEIFT
ncbi:MAG TPA: hypothetical protein VG965_01235 [Patescibacteria group bacterium]|nr:hypothetical protein [Patescibacteria group bacterium]